MRPLGAWLRIILGTAGLAGFLTVLLALLYRYEWRIDLSEGQRYTLSAHARQLLAALDHDVELIAFLRGENPRNPYIRDLLRQIGTASPRIRSEEVDVNRSPARAHQYGVTTYGAVVVESGGRHRVVSNPREQTIMLAVLQVTRDEPKTVYFVVGHGERTPTDRDREEGYSTAAARVGEEMYQVRVLSLADAEAVPEDATVLVVAGPQSRFSEAERTALDRFLAGGGGVLILVDALEEAGFAPYLARYGVIVRDETVVDPARRMLGGELVTLRIQAQPGHPITDALGAPPVFSLARPIEIGSAPPGAEVRSLLATGPHAWATSDRDVLAHGTPQFVDGRDRRGPLSIGVETQMPAPAGRPGGRLIVYGNAAFASNFFLEREGNVDLLLNTINWLAGEIDLIAPRAPRKRPGTEQLLVLGDEGASIFWLTVAVVPGFYLLLGLGQAWRQRHAG
jgi:ABC-type uncharacterized transport system involved in gliding motility auxiliary subunit